VRTAVIEPRRRDAPSRPDATPAAGAGCYRRRLGTCPEPLQRPQTRRPLHVSHLCVTQVPSFPEPPQLRQRPSPWHVSQVSIGIDHLPARRGASRPVVISVTGITPTPRTGLRRGAPPPASPA
jgi:hypothetical protein